MALKKQVRSATRKQARSPFETFGPYLPNKSDALVYTKGATTEIDGTSYLVDISGNDNHLTIISGESGPLTSMVLAFSDNTEMRSVDTALGGDVLFDSSDSMAPFERSWAKWYNIFSALKSFRVFWGTDGIAIYSSAQSLTVAYKCMKLFKYPTFDLLPSGALAAYDFIQGADSSVLYDVSGNDRHGAFASSPNDPEWSSNRGVAFFKPDSTHITIPSSAIVSGDSAFTVIVSGHLSQRYDGYYNVLFGYGAVAGLHRAPAIYLTANNPTTMQLRTGGGDNLNTVYQAGTNHRVYVYQYNPAGQELSGQVDDNSQESTTLSAVMNANETSGAKIGAYSTGNSDPLNGFITGVAIWDKVLTDEEISTAVAAMSDQLVSDLVVFDGDSLTIGSSPAVGASNYPHQCMYSIREGWDWYQFGVYGQTSTQMLADFDTQIKPLFGNARSNQVLVAWEIGNELSGLGAETAHTNFKNYCLHARSVLPANTKIVVCNVLPRGTAGFNTLRNTANALMDAQWSTYADALVDLAADSDIGQDSSCTDTTYYLADEIHMTATGYAIVAGLVKDAIEAL